MLTNVLLEGNQLLYFGNDEIISQVFNATPEDNAVFLPHVLRQMKPIQQSIFCFLYTQEHRNHDKVDDCQDSTGLEYGFYAPCYIDQHTYKIYKDGSSASAGQLKHTLCRRTSSGAMPWV